MRTIIQISPVQRRALDELCRRQRISRAEAVRRAVDFWLERQQPAAPDDGPFGLWAERGEDSLAVERRLRAEWDQRA